METDQIKLLKKLADKIKAEKRTKEQCIASLRETGILTKTGRFAKPYRELGKAIKDYNKTLKQAK